MQSNTLLIIDLITCQRHALATLRKDVCLSRTDIELLAFAHRFQLFNFYQLRCYYFGTNIQQLRYSLSRLQKINGIELVKQGVKNKPALYLISPKGSEILDKFINLIQE